MSDYTEQTWAWVHEPLHRLRESCRTEPAEPWEQRLTVFLGELGLSSADDHPVVRTMADEVERQGGTDEERAAFVADDGFDALVYQWITDSDTATGTDASTDAGTAQEAQGDPAEVSGQAVSLIGLPALRAVAAAHPGPLDAETVTTVVASVLAHRLTGQAPPHQDELATALLARVEEQLGAQETVAGQFWAVFGSGPVDVAEQWVTHHLAQLAGEIAALLPAPVLDQEATAPVLDQEPVAPVLDQEPTAAPALDQEAVVAAVLKEVPDAEEVLTPEEINRIIAEELGASATDRPMGS